RNRTFVFLSAETSSLRFSGLELAPVPSLAARQEASGALQRALNMFPLPTGRELGPKLSEGILALTTAASLRNYSMRIDQSLGARGTVFGRLVVSPSSSQSDS